MSPLFEPVRHGAHQLCDDHWLHAPVQASLGIIQNDIKRVGRGIPRSRSLAWRALPNALRRPAYSVAVFHRMTHAFFALLFLAAGLRSSACTTTRTSATLGGPRKYMKHHRLHR
jgi:NADH:ubiquinone oxidoreductase subunit 5 (subunit L)/multisubunit Na+/H+ antiporter MnhA subunit